MVVLSQRLEKVKNEQRRSSMIKIHPICFLKAHYSHERKGAASFMVYLAIQ